MRRTVIAVAVLLAVGGAVVLWPRGPRMSDEARILETILAVKRAVETRDAGGVLKRISDDYSDGTHTKQDIVGLVVEAFRSPEPFHVHAEQPQVTITGDRATAQIRAEFWTGDNTTPSDHQKLDVTAEFVREGRTWKLSRASGWEAAAGQVE